MARVTLLYGTADETEAAFYDALSRADVDAVMAVWADDDEIVCIHPGAPRLVGHAAIRASWEAIFAAGPVLLQPMQLHLSQNMLTAVHSVVEHVRRTANDGDDVHVLATNVYLKTAQGWRMVMHHASIAPGAVAGDMPSSAMLH